MSPLLSKVVNFYNLYCKSDDSVLTRLSLCIGTIHKRRQHFFCFFDTHYPPSCKLFLLLFIDKFQGIFQIVDVFYGRPFGSILQFRIFIHNVNIDSTKVWSFTHQILIENMSNSMWPLTPSCGGYIWNETKIMIKSYLF